MQMTCFRLHAMKPLCNRQGERSAGSTQGERGSAARAEGRDKSSETERQRLRAELR